MSTVQTATAVPQAISSSALSSGKRPARPDIATSTLVFGWRALLRIKHIPSQIFDVTMFPLIMLVMFTYLFGGALAGSTSTYLQSVLPGILVMTIVMTTQSTGVALNSDITKGIFDRFRSLPIWQPAALAGALLADLARYAISATVVVGVGTLLGFRPAAGVPGLLLGVGLALLFAWSLSWVWTSIGLIISAPESMMFLGMMITFPLTFVSNVFIDPTTLPDWLERFVDINPITHLVSAVRGLMHGEQVAGDVTWVLVSCVVLVAVFAPISMRLYRRER